MIDRLKKRWGVQSTWQVVTILIVFSVAGTSILFVKPYIYDALGISPEASPWIRYPLIILFYQVLLLIWGTLFGQFRFFWEKEKKLGRLLFGWTLPRKRA